MYHLFLLSFLSLWNPPHDIAMAVFAVTLEENSIQLKVQLDKTDIETVLNIDKEVASSKVLIAEYLTKNVIWIINNQPVEFTFISIEKSEDHYLLEAVPVPFKAPFMTIDLHNTCLIEEVAKHSNVIYIKQKDKEMRGFRMNKKRRQISIDL